LINPNLLLGVEKVSNYIDELTIGAFKKSLMKKIKKNFAPISFVWQKNKKNREQINTKIVAHSFQLFFLIQVL
jgi:hypothetical protein